MQYYIILLSLINKSDTMKYTATPKMITEIRLITRCSTSEAEAIHMMLMAQFTNIGAIKYSCFVHHARKAHLLLSLKYSLN